MIFVSTGGIRKITAVSAARHFYHAGVRNVELSGGAFSAHPEEDLLGLPDDLNVRFHNYYPPPDDPFVLNLASSVEEIRIKSEALVRNAIRLSAVFGASAYAVHAGFLANLKVDDLGGAARNRGMQTKEQAIENFTRSVQSLEEVARQSGVKLLIENNVLTQTNLQRFTENPLLCVDPDGIISVLRELPESVRLLMDVAHLNVSAKTLGFCRYSALERLGSYIGGYHFSDNDGLADSNCAVTKRSWFWPYARKDLGYYTLEIYNETPEVLVDQVNLAEQILMG